MSDINELYSLVKREKNFDKFKIPVRLYKPVLTEKNFRDGFVERYFAKYTPSPSLNITEVDEFTFKQLRKNPMYQIIELRWQIVGKKNNYIINKDCCNNKPITIIEQTGTIFNLTPAEFGARNFKVGDRIVSNGYNIALGIESQNRKSIEFADLTMPGLIRYITNYTEYWQGE
jgi:hypothetical protein